MTLGRICGHFKSLATHPQLLAPVLQIVHRIISTFLIKQAGLKRTEAQSGAVTLIHAPKRMNRTFETRTTSRIKRPTI